MKRLLIACSGLAVSAGTAAGLILSSSAGPVFMHGAWLIH